MLCKECSLNNCKEHVSSKIITDAITGLQIEAKCLCNNCGSEIK